MNKRGAPQLELATVSWAAAFNALGDAIFTADAATGMLLDASQKAQQLTGRSREEICRMHYSELHPPEHAALAEKLFREIAEHGRSVAKGLCLLGRDGRRIPMEIAANVVEIDGRRVVMGIFRDVTDRQRTEESLRLSEQRLRLHVEQTSLGFIEWDTNFRVVRWNPAAEQIFGYTAAEAQGQHGRFIVPPSERAHVEQAWSHLAYGQRGGECSINANVTKAGRTILCEWHNTSLTTTDGKVVGVASAVQDITDRKRVEAALAEAKAAAEAANRAKSEFLANVSHELRTPLHAVLGMTELAMRDELPATVQAYLELANDSAEMLLELLNEILDFSRMEAGRMVIENVEFNLRTMLDQAMKSLGLKAQQKGLELCLDLPRHVPTHLIGDPLRLRQVVTNLVGNAIKFTERGEVVVRVAVESCEAETVVLRFSVTDTGIGMSREYQKHIFEPFSQADSSTTRRYGGTGLGLPIALTLARLMGGRLEVDSELGRGSTFFFTAQFRLPSEFAEPTPLEIAFLGQLRDLPVLVVDSHSTNRQILCDTLKGWGMKPEPADCARTALSQAQQARAAGRPFPVAIVDPDLADLNGWDLIPELRKHQRRRAATIALVSSASYPALAKRHRLVARALPLSKPVAQGELLRAIVRGLGLASASALKPAPAALPPSSPRRLRILLAEDTAAGRLFATDVLQERGHAVQTAEDGREAFELVRDQDFDVVLMDVQMPAMDGFQTTAAIRALPDPAKSRVPIVAITAHALLGYQERCLAAGMNGYLSKPLRSHVLIELVERLAESLAPA